MSELQKLSEKLIALREGGLSVSSFHDWLNNSDNQSIHLIAKGMLLKLKRGDMNKIMSVAAVIVPCCEKCNVIYRLGEFKSRKEYSICESSVEKALSSHILSPSIKPIWYEPSKGQLGADSYYKCTKCGAVWNLVLPERHCNGLWDRVA
jgi:hypothetical protein